MRCVAASLQVFDEYDDEVAEAEAAEGAGSHQREDRDQDLKPFTSHRGRWDPGAGGWVVGMESRERGWRQRKQTCSPMCTRAARAAFGLEWILCAVRNRKP